MTDDLYELIKDCLPNDHAGQVEARYFVERILKDSAKGRRVLDLGCGDGRSVDLFRRIAPTVVPRAT